MKFAKVFQQALIEEDIPDEWVEAAIQYKLLKKCIGKVVKEIEFLGLTKMDLKLLLRDDSGDETVDLDEDANGKNNGIIAKYLLAKSEKSNEIKPMLKLTINDEARKDITSGELQELAESVRARVRLALNSSYHEKQFVEIKEGEEGLELSPTTSHEGEELVTINNNEIVILLKSDEKFFGMLNSELKNLDNLRLEEELNLLGLIEHLSEAVILFTNRRSDLYLWRELFKLYLDSEIFFRFNETSSSLLERAVEQIKRNLDHFSSIVSRTEVLQRMQKRKSLTAYNEFVALNERLFKIIQFQSINSEALRKILKKFDKQTSFNVSSRFPALISDDHVFINGSSIAQKICFTMQNKLLRIIPQLEDYSCPICVSVAYKPIRLSCGHLFCVRCLVKMKQRQKTDCPICRSSKAIAIADSSNLDSDAMLIIQRSFPIEIKEKLRDAEKERYKEVMGNRKGCCIC